MIEGIIKAEFNIFGLYIFYFISGLPIVAFLNFDRFFNKYKYLYCVPLGLFFYCLTSLSFASITNSIDSSSKIYTFIYFFISFSICIFFRRIRNFFSDYVKYNWKKLFFIISLSIIIPCVLPFLFGKSDRFAYSYLSDFTWYFNPWDFEKFKNLDESLNYNFGTFSTIIKPEILIHRPGVWPLLHPLYFLNQINPYWGDKTRYFSYFMSFCYVNIVLTSLELNQIVLININLEKEKKFLKNSFSKFFQKEFIVKTASIFNPILLFIILEAYLTQTIYLYYLVTIITTIVFFYVGVLKKEKINKRIFIQLIFILSLAILLFYPEYFSPTLIFLISLYILEKIFTNKISNFIESSKTILILSFQEIRYAFLKSYVLALGFLIIGFNPFLRTMQLLYARATNSHETSYSLMYDAFHGHLSSYLLNLIFPINFLSLFSKQEYNQALIIVLILITLFFLIFKLKKIDIKYKINNQNLLNLIFPILISLLIPFFFIGIIQYYGSVKYILNISTIIFPISIIFLPSFINVVQLLTAVIMSIYLFIMGPNGKNYINYEQLRSQKDFLKSEYLIDSLSKGKKVISYLEPYTISNFLLQNSNNINIFNLRTFSGNYGRQNNYLEINKREIYNSLNQCIFTEGFDTVLFNEHNLQNDSNINNLINCGKKNNLKLEEININQKQTMYLLKKEK